MGQTGRGNVIPGFYISNCGFSDSYSASYEDMLQESLTADGWAVARRTFKRFLDDKTLFMDDQCCIVLEGVILNKSELYARYGVDSITELVKSMRTTCGEDFFKEFRGSFAGAYYEIASGVWTVWTNHYGNNEVFYSVGEDHVVLGSNYWDVLAEVKKQVEISLDERAVYSMLTYGGMNSDQTYVSEIKRILPGHYLKIDAAGCVSDNVYWSISHNSHDLNGCSENQIIDELDRLFRRAVDRQFNKDREYGYRHLAELSGGLDSRMISWVAHDLGYTDVVNMTFCQAGYLDETVAKKISTDLGNQFMFMPMDDAGFITDVDEIISLNFGLTIYSGTTGLRRFLDNLYTDAFGLIHSGTAGDVVIGSFLHEPSELTDMKLGGLYSPMLHKEALAITDFSQFENQEDYLLFTRAFLTVGTSDLIRRGYSDVASPFMDIDFFDYCMSIPLEYRCNHRVYKQWICMHYPEAAKYVWEKQGVPVSAGRVRAWLAGKIRALSILGIQGTIEEISKRLGLRAERQRSGRLRRGMNPFDYWFAIHPDLERKISDIYASDHELEHELPARVIDALDKVYEQGTAQESTLAITALHTIRRVFTAC